MNKNKKPIGIIGAGASGIMCLYQLVEKFSHNSTADISIKLIDKSGSFGPGLAYSTPLNSHIINMSAETMSAVSGKPHHFVNWLKSNNHQIKKEYPYLSNHNKTYPPRKVYGDYLTDIGLQVVEKARKNQIDVELVHGEVVDIQEEGSNKSLFLLDGQVFEIDYAIMALGNFPSTVLQEFKGKKGYFPYPWPVQNIMNHIPSNEPVCILGSGLSAMDSLFTLLENDHKGTIFFISRRGTLPKVQGEPHEYTLKYLKNHAFEDQKYCLDEIITHLRNEIEAAEGKKLDWDKLLNPMKSPEEILEKDIAEANTGIIPLQSVLRKTSDIVGYLWNHLSYEDQRKFDCNYKSIWTVFRHPMPLVNAEKILKVLQTGQLNVLSGFGCVRYLGDNKGFEVDIQSQDKGACCLKTRFFINATGQGLDITKYDDPLVQNLLRRGMIVPHPSGGILADFDTSLVKPKNGKPLPWLFALGEITRGVHFFTNAISHIALYADRIAGHVFEGSKTL